MTNWTDLTKISASFHLEFDTLDVVLLVTTGGVGYLARQAYRHFDGKPGRNVEAQSEAFRVFISEAQAKGAKKAYLRVSPNVPVFAPAGGRIRFLQQTIDYNEVEISFG